MRPKIICHMISSIDGRLLVERWTRFPGDDLDTLHGLYDAVAERFEADGWLVGRKTMEGLTGGSPRNLKVAVPIPRSTHVGRRLGRNLAVILDPHGKLHYGDDNLYGDHVVAVLGTQVSDGYLAELREGGVSYVFAGDDGRDLASALSVLADSFDVTCLLLQGGGITSGVMLKAGMIDEFSLLISPAVDGLSGIPSIIDYHGSSDERPAAGQRLRHIATETLEGGTVWLHYGVDQAAELGNHENSAP